MLRLAMMFSVLVPMAGLAETVVVRSGDHAGFSRLAFKFSHPVSWKMGRSGTAYELRFDRNDLTFDIRSVYKKISRLRVHDIRILHAGKRLAIDLGCNCHADAFEFRSGLLVVDIKDGPPRKGDPFETTFAADETADATAEKTTPVADKSVELTLAKPEDAAFAIPNLINRREGMTQNAAAEPLPTGYSGKVGPVNLTGTASDRQTMLLARAFRKPEDRIAGMQSELAKEIGRAATQGLLDAKVNIPAATSTGSLTEPKIAVPEETDLIRPVNTAGQHSRQSRAHIQAQTSIDRDSGTTPTPPENLTDNGDTCLPDAIFDIANWGTDSNPFAEIPVQRGKLFGEFDRLNPSAAEGLIQAYIYAGFGQEARAVRDAVDINPKHMDVMLAMAEIMDDGWAFERGVLKGQTDCNGAVALWAVLALPKIPVGMAVNKAAVKRYFSALPRHLRKHLGPILAERFLAAGDKETAVEIRNAFTRSDGKPDPALELLDARLHELDGSGRQAEESYQKVYKGNGTLAARALVELLQKKLDANEDIPSDLVQAAQAQAFERRGTKTGDDLATLAVLSLSRNGRYQAALADISTMWKRDPQNGKDVGSILSVLISNATDHGSDAMFLSVAFNVIDGFAGVPIEHDIRRKMSLRLAEIGFPGAAQKAMEIFGQRDNADRLTLAQIALAQGKPNRTLDYLDGYADPQSARLRALAFELKGDLLAAEQQYQAINDRDGRRQAAWLRKDWTQLMKIGSAMDRKVAEMALSVQDSGMEVPAEGASLKRYQELLSIGQARDNTLQLILKAFPPVAEKNS